MKYIIIILQILIPFTINSQAIVNETVAEELLLLEQNIWQTTNDSAKIILLIEKSKKYQAEHMYKLAVAELDRVPQNFSDDSLAAVVEYEKMLNYFLNADYGYCKSIHISTENINRINKKNEYALMRLQALNETEKWQECKQELLATNVGKDSVILIQIQQLPEAYKYISPEKCRKLSSFLPGLGEVKAGYTVKGITSFVINAGLLAFTGYNFYTGYYVTGAVAGIFPFLKFYSGGKRLSESLAHKHNEKEKKELQLKYSEFINKTIK